MKKNIVPGWAPINDLNPEQVKRAKRGLRTMFPRRNSHNFENEFVWMSFKDKDKAYETLERHGWREFVEHGVNATYYIHPNCADLCIEIENSILYDDERTRPIISVGLIWPSMVGEREVLWLDNKVLQERNAARYRVYGH